MLLLLGLHSLSGYIALGAHSSTRGSGPTKVVSLFLVSQGITARSGLFM